MSSTEELERLIRRISPVLGELEKVDKGWKLYDREGYRFVLLRGSDAEIIDRLRIPFCDLCDRYHQHPYCPRGMELRDGRWLVPETENA